MTTTQTQAGTHESSPAAALSAADLAELMTAFNEVTSKLERTHAQLRGEVRRLSAELREANEALQRSKRLAALGEMAAGIAHEVRNPLGSIGLYARMLEEDLGDRPDCLAIAEKISAAVRGLNAVVGDVLTFAKELRVRPVVCDAGELLARAAAGCPDLGGVVEVASCEPIEFECDQSMVHQALLNVVRNACDANAAAGGSRVLLSAARGFVDPGDADPVPGVVIRVRDEGDGFPPGAIERVFNPFFTTRAAGTGLGLPIVHRIVDAHGGRVALFNNDRDEPGSRGATVELRLPLRVVSPDVVVLAGSPVAAGVVSEGSL
ncbi:MAG: hypothetical protein D6692_03650 [Planctomycetota bacterium]|nr:MAG: hypothetical protein D6692_03650 [Planctomycetota bacterium]